MSLINSRYFIWILLALPSIPMIMALIAGEPNSRGHMPEHYLLHPTGEFSARFLIITMMLTPLKMIFSKSRFVQWLMRRRRYFGVASFAYAALHTVLYIWDAGSLQKILGEFFELGIWTGWLAMFIFLPLAITSNDWSVRKMGSSWKTLQRLVYISAVATVLHWIFIDNHIGPALVHFLPLAALEAYRVWHNMTRRRAAIAGE